MNKISFHEIEAKSYESPKKQFATIERSVTKALDLRHVMRNAAICDDSARKLF